MSDDDGPGPDRLGAGHSDVIGDLTRWLAEARVDAAAESRARERWLRQQLLEEATLAGVLLDLAERGSSVAVHGSSGRRHSGTIRAVADDFCAVRSAEGHDALLAYAGITSVEPHRVGAVMAGGRPAALDMTLREALTSLAGERYRVLAVATTGRGIAGELRSVGLDVMVIRPDGESRSAYLSLATVVEVTITG